MIAQLTPPINAAFTVSARFPERMVRHLWKHFPDFCKGLGPTLTREAVFEGIERAFRYGIWGDREVCLFIDLLFAFGPTFDVDEEYAWLHPILNDGMMDPYTKMQKIYATGLSLNRFHRGM
ncbi:MAG: hypothetical protein ACYTAF_02195 [Planctomycetota bacterium]|jgi:hypothetical protein